MNIPESILSNFAKLTTNSDTKLKEYTFYGTVMLVDLSGNATVKFDGADITTYCESSVPVKENDRVIVTIRNRTAVITSNLTTKTLIADYLESGSARIKGELVGCTGTFAGELTAATGTFAGELKAATGTFSGDLSAAGGTFSGDLSAAGGTFSGDLSAAGGTFKGDLSAAGGTFKGNLSAAGGTFKGNLSAAKGTFAGELQAASGTFKGNLSAASGTFKGDLSAAGGTFTGAVKFSWNNYTYPTDVYIGTTTTENGTRVTAPIWVVAYAFQNKIGSIETHIQPGEVTVNIDRQDDQGIWTSYSSELTPDGVNTSSDRRLKADILDIDADIAMQLRPVEYRLRSERSGSKHYGFIAQEVMDVIPNAVKKNKDGYYGLIYNEMIAPALALAQRNAKKVEELEERIAKLEEMLNVKT